MRDSSRVQFIAPFYFEKMFDFVIILFVLDMYYFSSFTVVGCNLLHHFILEKMFVFVICFVCFGYVLLFFFYCLGFCFTIAVIDCALLVINSAIATSSFTLRKIRSAHIKRKRSTKKKRNQLGYQNSSSSLCPVRAS